MNDGRGSGTAGHGTLTYCNKLQQWEFSMKITEMLQCWLQQIFVVSILLKSS